MMGVGLFGGGTAAAIAMYMDVHGWIKSRCAEQGPDYIKANIASRFRVLPAVAFVVWLLFMAMDAIYFRNSGVWQRMFGWADKGMFAWPLWGGAFLGLSIGTVVGVFVAMLSFEKSKCVLGIKRDKVRRASSAT